MVLYGRLVCLVVWFQWCTYWNLGYILRSCSESVAFIHTIQLIFSNQSQRKGNYIRINRAIIKMIYIKNKFHCLYIEIKKLFSVLRNLKKILFEQGVAKLDF